MVFYHIDQDVKSFGAGDLLAPVYKPPLASDMFFPSPSNFTTPSSRFVPYPSDESSFNSLSFDASTTPNYPLSAPCVGQQQPFYDNHLHHTATNMDMPMNFPGGVSEEALKAFWMQRLADHQYVMGPDAAPPDLPPFLQLRWFGGLFEEGTRPGPVVTQGPIAQGFQNIDTTPAIAQNIEPAPVVAQEPIAQGLQDNDALGFTYPDPEFNNYVFVTDPAANIVLPTVIPKIEQDPVEATHSDVDAKVEPVVFPCPFPPDLPKVETSQETYEAIGKLTALPVKQLVYAMAFLQHNLCVKQHNRYIKQNNLLINQGGHLIEQNIMMPDQEMDIDQPEEMDGITDSDDDLPKPARPVRKEIYNIPPPDLSSRDSCNEYLLTCRDMGFTYKEIMAAGGLKDAEPTLRGRYRTLTKDPAARVRKPKWTRQDVELLEMVTFRWFSNNNIDPGSRRPHWLQIAQEMKDAGSSYHFGAGTVSRKWARLHPDLVARRP